MTLILMGHEISRRDVGDRFVYEHDVARPLGLFAVADSALTKKQERDGEPTHYRTLLTGLRKIHEVRILVMRPDLSPSGSFEGRYFDKAYEASAFIAFAGNANSAHHALNIIRTHLEHLKLSFRFPRQPGEPKGNIIVRSCETNPMETIAAEFADDTFFGEHVDRLFNADYFASVVSHSIQVALKSVLEYCHNDDEIRDALATFAFGAWCPVERVHKLYHLEPKRKVVDGRYQLIASPRLIPEREVLVLGTPALQATLPIQATYDDALASDQSPAEELRKLLDGAIDQDHAAFTGFPVNRPLALYRFKEGYLKRPGQ